MGITDHSLQMNTHWFCYLSCKLWHWGIKDIKSSLMILFISLKAIAAVMGRSRSTTCHQRGGITVSAACQTIWHFLPSCSSHLDVSMQNRKIYWQFCGHITQEFNLWKNPRVSSRESQFSDLFFFPGALLEYIWRFMTLQTEDKRGFQQALTSFIPRSSELK